jgi:hypothetical protein
MVLGTATTLAEEPPLATIESYVVENIDDDTDVTEGHLMAGGRYRVYLTIKVGVDLGNNTLILSTPMEKVGDRYWQLENDYEGVDTELWQPGLPQIEFNVVQGDAEFILEGSVPSKYTQESLPNEEYLHFPKSISLVQLSLGPEGDQLGERSLIVKDQAILAYEQTLADKERLLQEATTDPNEADPKYVKLVEDVIDRAEDLYANGYVENAKALLDTLPISVSGFPIPVSEESFLPYLIGIVVLAVILIVSVALLLRARANSSFIRQQVDEEAGRLDVLSVRISKIDKQLGEDVEQVKEELERIIGR